MVFVVYAVYIEAVRLLNCQWVIPAVHVADTLPAGYPQPGSRVFIRSLAVVLYGKKKCCVYRKNED
jgi:hypothetical protein